jgi:YVTN family beta-propeller protein
MKPSSSLSISACATGALVVLVLAGLVPLAQQGPPPARWPGRQQAGVTLLPNGWTIAPVGRHVYIGDLPLAQVLSPDGRYVIVTNNGWSKPTLTIYDLQNQYTKQRVPLDHAWLGLTWHPDGKRLYSAGAAQNTIQELTFGDGRLTKGALIKVSEADKQSGEERGKSGFVGGLAISPDGGTLFALQVFGKSLTAIDTTSKSIRKTVALEAEPYTAITSADGKTLFVSSWGGAKVLLFNPATLEPMGEVLVGEHPNAMVLSKDGTRLFVACANTNAVWIVDLASKTAKEQVSVALYPDSPAGTTPNALALSPDGNTLLVANADNNTVGVIDVQKPGASKVQGFIPTGWYPTGVSFTRDGSHLLILSGKGLTSAANPRGPSPGDRGMDGQYSGAMMQGSLTTLAMPDAAALKQYTAKVYEITAYSDKKKLTPEGAPADSPIPAKVGARSPIKYVFYVIRENRTFDQVLGDLGRGNGDPSLAILGEDVTPNAHALSREFVTFDNFYVDAEVSYDGHAFSTGAYAPDAVEKIWPTYYGGRGGQYLSEGGGEYRNKFGNIDAPADGYIWDFAKRGNVTVRSYGEFADWDGKGTPVKARVPGLEGHVAPNYPPWDLSIPDNERIDAWQKEFKEFEANGQLPHLNILRLGNDHTNGTRPGAPTPRAMVAENDVAIGRLVEIISNSKFWNESAIFILEDDAQNGSDHVDAHRSVALVISPFTKRRVVDSTLYTTSSLLRTMELILGLPPMSQYDAAATPMYNAFTPTPTATPYKHLEAQVSLTEKNEPTAPGSQASLRMNMQEADLAPDLELNEIIWKSIRGADSQMPPPVRSAFIRPRANGDEDEDEDDR